MENITEGNDKNEIINFVNSNDQPINSNNLNNKTYDKNIHDDDDDYVEQNRYNQIFGLCPGCNQPNTFRNWCKECYAKKFQQNFCNWTSGNEHVDEFIQEAQLNARLDFELLEWIPYNRLRNIQYLVQGGFSIVYKAIWLDGPIESWDYEKQQWKRDLFKLDERYFEDAKNPKIKNPLKHNEEYGYPVVLKSLIDSQNINEDFLNEVNNH